MTHILLSRWGNKPKTGVWRSWALHPTRWDSMPCFYSFCPSYSWFSIMIILLVSSFVEMLDILLMPCFDSLVNPFMVTTSISLNKLSRTYCRILLAKLHIHKIELLSLYTMFLLKFSYTCMVRYILWYLERIGEIHGCALCGKLCVRGGPPRSQAMLIDDGYTVGKRYMHGSCQFHKLPMSLHATWCSLKIPAICPPVMNCF